MSPRAGNPELLAEFSGRPPVVEGGDDCGDVKAVDVFVEAGEQYGRAGTAADCDDAQSFR